MARKMKRPAVTLQNTPKNSANRTPRATKPRLIEFRDRSIKKKRSMHHNRMVRQQKLLRKKILKEKQFQSYNAISTASDVIFCEPSAQPESSNKPLTKARKRAKIARDIVPQPSLIGDPIVIDSEDEDDTNHKPLFYVDNKGGYNDKEVPKYKKRDPDDDDLSVMLVESTLEEGEIRDEDLVETVGSAKPSKVKNKEEIPIPEEDDEEDSEENSEEGWTLKTVPLPKQLDSADQSVIFCSEVIDLAREDSRPKALDFIPIGRPSPKRRRKNKITTNQIVDSSTCAASNESETIKRFVVIDGNNVAFSHAQGQSYSVKGLDICIKYFKNLGHVVKAVVPQYRLRKDKSTDQKLLEELYKNGDVLLAPSKNLPGQRSSSYDDRLLISVAEKFDGVVISNDNFRDLLTENDSWKKIIKTRVIGYTWAMDEFFLPDDPYGRHGPKLKELLEGKKKAKNEEK